MRGWLWNDLFDNFGHYSSSNNSLGYAVVTIGIVFIVCAGIDRVRASYLMNLWRI